MTNRRPIAPFMAFMLLGLGVQASLGVMVMQTAAQHHPFLVAFILASLFACTPLGLAIWFGIWLERGFRNTSATGAA